MDTLLSDTHTMQQSMPFSLSMATNQTAETTDSLLNRADQALYLSPKHKAATG